MSMTCPADRVRVDTYGTTTSAQLRTARAIPTTGQTMILPVQDKRRRTKDPDGSENLQVKHCLLVLLAVLLVSCVGQEARQMSSKDQMAKCVSQSVLKMTDKPSIVQLGNILLVDKSSPVLPGQKVFVATFDFEKGKIEAQEVLVAFGTGKIPYSQQCDFWFELVDGEGKALARYGIWNPRKVIAEADGIAEADKQRKTGLVEVPVARFSARFPFSVNAQEIRVLGAKQQTVASTDVRAAIRGFCKAHKDDPDCRKDFPD